MSDRKRADHDVDDLTPREILIARVRLLFGDERVEPDEAEIDAVAAAIERVRRLSPPEFSGLDPAERG